jgi:hypothetical protein
MKITLPSPVQNILGILNWKLGPEVLPNSPILLALSMAGFAGAVFLRQAMDYSLAAAAMSGIGSAAVLGTVAFLWAKLSGYNERLPQTLMALALGGGIVIFATTALRFFMVIVYTLQGLPDINISELSNFLLFPLFVWNVFVFAALFRRSFRPSLPVAFAIAIPLVLTVDFWVPVAFKHL